MKSLLTLALGLGTLSLGLAGACSSSNSTPNDNPETGTQKDAATDHHAKEDQDMGDGGSPDGDMCGDAGGALPTDCLSCLESKCGAELSACACDPTCLSAVGCYNGCSEDGGSGLSCANSCSPMETVGEDTGTSTSVNMINCVISKCPSDCEASQGDGGGGEAGSGDDGGPDGASH
jgi:hypothetical protein